MSVENGILRIKANIEFPVEIRTTIEVPKIVALIGPNLSGKTTFIEHTIISLRNRGTKVFLMAPYITDYGDQEKYFEDNNNSLHDVVVEEKIDYVVYVNSRAPSVLASDISNLRKMLRASYLAEAISVADEELFRIYSELKGAQHEEEYEVIDMILSKLNEDPHSISTYSAYVMTIAIYSYALSKENRVLLLVDEPEAYTYPSVVYALARIFKHLAEKSDNMFMIIATHSWDFLTGLKSNLVRVYNFRRVGNKVNIEPLDKGLYIPGFSVSGLLA